jgi:acid phosphatase
MKLFTAVMAVAAATVASVNAYSDGFDLLDHTSQLNFYHPAKPVLTDAQTALPAECEVDQVYAMARHMTRYPSNGSYNGCMKLSARIHDTIAKNGPPATKELQFFVGWNFSDIVPDAKSMPENITMLGLQEGKEMGKSFRAKYAHLYNDKTTVWAGSVERVQLTAKAFMDGYFGEGKGYANLVTSDSKDYTKGANTITPIDGCPNFIKDSLADKPTDEYLAKAGPPMVARWKALWPEFGFVDHWDVFGFMDLCMYERNIVSKDQTRICKLFTDEEWETYAYYRDIGYYYGSAYGNPLARTVGYPLVSAIASLMTKETTPFCQNVFVGFTHDTQLSTMMSAVGIAYDKDFSSSPSRIYHSSRLVAMGSRFVTERLKCGNKRYVRVSVNDAIHPVLDCTSGPGMSCPLEDYVTKIAAVGKAVGDFKTACNVTNLSNGASSKFELFDKPLTSQCKPSVCPDASQ